MASLYDVKRVFTLLNVQSLTLKPVELNNSISTIEELWAKIPLFAAEMEQDIKDDLQAGLWDLVNSSSIDLGVQLPKVKSLTVERDLTYLLI